MAGVDGTLLSKSLICGCLYIGKDYKLSSLILNIVWVYSIISISGAIVP